MQLIFKLTERYINMKFKDNLDNVEPCSMNAVMADRKVTAKKDQKNYSDVMSYSDGKTKKLTPKALSEDTTNQSQRIRQPYSKDMIDSNNINYSNEDRSNGLDKKVSKDLWTQVYDELAPMDTVVIRKTKFPNLRMSQRYTNDVGIDNDSNIVVYGATPQRLDAAKDIADAYDVEISDVIPVSKFTSQNDPNRKFKRIVKINSDLDMAEGLLDVAPVVNNIKRLSETECDEGVGTAVVKGGKYTWKAIKFCISHMTEIATALEALGMSVDEIKKIIDTFKGAKQDDKQQEPITEVLPAAVVTGAKVLGTAAASLAAEKGLDLLDKNAESIRMKENYSVKSALNILKRLDE